MSVTGLNKMRKDELLELCKEKGIDPPRTVADMRYVLKRKFDEEDEDDDDDSDTEETEDEPPQKKQKQAAKVSPGTLTETDGDATSPVGSGTRIILHSVAKGFTWSPKGSMGRITSNFGTEPRVQHDSQQHRLRLGSVQFVDVKDSITVASALCQSKPSKGEVVPPFDPASYTRALKIVADKALAIGATVHIASLDPRIPGYDADQVAKEVDEQLTQRGVNVFTYRRAGRGGGGSGGYQKKDEPPAAAVAAPVAQDSGVMVLKASDSLVVPPATPSKELRRRYILQRIQGKTYDDFPLEDGEAKLTPVEKDTEEFWDLEERFNANLQGRNEDYVSKRIKKGQAPIRFILIGAKRVENEVLECRFELKRQELLNLRGQKDGRERVSFHGTHPRNCNGILTTSLLRFKHKLNKCKKQVDDGYFGSNKKGVYVSRYADYTLKYANNVVPLRPEEEVETIFFRTLPGKTKHIKELCGAIDPTDGFDSHSSPEFLEWYLFDEAQLCPEYVFKIRAEEDTRTKADDQ